MNRAHPATPSAKNSVTSGTHYSLWGSTPVRTAAVIALFSAAAVYESFQATAVYDRDIWLHLRTGLWMLQSHAVPRSGWFSQHADLPWVSCSWGYELVLAVLYKLLGLRALPALLMAFKVALAVLTFALARGWSGNFWGAVLLSAVAQYAIAGFQPLAPALSILFFGIELLLLMHIRRRGDLRALFWLALLFLLWANLHSQFVTGLLILAIFVLVQAAERLSRSVHAPWNDGPNLPLGRLAAAAGVAALATLLNPYGPALLSNAFKNAYGGLLLDNLPGLTPLGFRRPQDFVLALLAMLAFFSLGRQRSRDPFKVALMFTLTVLAFRIQRDAWTVVLAATAVLGDFLGSSRREPQASWKWQKPVTAGVVIVVFLASLLRVPGGEALMTKASQVFPVKACDFIHASRLPGPLFNPYRWGGFLTWYLPDYPVAMDARLNLYGGEITQRHLNLFAGDQPSPTEPAFAQARTILLERQSKLALGLTRLPGLREQFRAVYQDEVAIVFVRR